MKSILGRRTNAGAVTENRRFPGLHATRNDSSGRSFTRSSRQSGGGDWHASCREDDVPVAGRLPAVGGENAA
jgi:hypothetical protein